MAIDVSRRIIEREEFATQQTDDGRIRALFLILFQRAPRDVELALAKNFLENARVEVAAAAPKPKLDGKGRPIPTKFDDKADDKRAAMMMDSMYKRKSGRTIRNEGDYVERRPPTDWESLTQSLLFTNEMVYVN
jgi:hypothetical protein